jgi:hypothetical protein
MWWYIAREEKCSKVERVMPLGNILGCWRSGNVETFSARGQGFAKTLRRWRQVHKVLCQSSSLGSVCESASSHLGHQLVLAHLLPTAREI